jgi:hypothetical protein
MGLHFKKLGRKMNIHGAKKLGKKFTGLGGKLGKKGGRLAENIGKLAVVAGGVTGIEPLAVAGGGLIASGKVAQAGGQVLRDTSKGKLEKASKGAISLAMSQT